MIFELMPLSWVKRRAPVTRPEIISFKVIDYSQTENAPCKILVKYDNGKSYETIGRTTENKIYRVGGGVISSHWTIQGFTPIGGIQLRVRDDAPVVEMVS